MFEILRKTGKTLGLLVISLAFAGVAQAEVWRGLSPLKSTRTDVERVLGSHQVSRDSYSTENETVTVVYAESSCAHGWDVPVGTVISFSIFPKNPLRIDKLALDETAYTKRQDVHIASVYYYINEEAGINYTVDLAKGVATKIEYYPPVRESSRRCRSASSQRSTALSTAERVRAMERLAPTVEYTCVMHPDVHQTQEGRCPKCGMVLTSVKPAFEGKYPLVLAMKPERPRAGAKTRLRFVVSNPVNGAIVKNYVLNHERLFHLFIISQDMNSYQHLHPLLKPDGSFELDVVFPFSGNYKLHGDFFPTGGTLQTLHLDLSTDGHDTVNTRAGVTLTPDKTFVNTVDGLTARLEMGSAAPATGVMVPLRFQLTDARTGKPARDLEPYLGAWGHTLILNEDQSEYLHSHPTVMLPDDPKRTALRGGPDVEFQTMFPVPGNYRIWTQFQRAGRVITFVFTVRVVE